MCTLTSKDLLILSTDMTSIYLIVTCKHLMPCHVEVDPKNESSLSRSLSLARTKFFFMLWNKTRGVLNERPFGPDHDAIALSSSIVHRFLIR